MFAHTAILNSETPSGANKEATESPQAEHQSLNGPGARQHHVWSNHFTARSLAAPFPCPPRWLPVLLAALAGGMGWVIRGQFGDAIGKLIAGLRASLRI